MSNLAVNDDLLRVFGLAGQRMVTGLSIDLVPGDYPRVTITKFVTAAELDQLQTLVEVHRLQPVLQSSSSEVPA